MKQLPCFLHCPPVERAGVLWDRPNKLLACIHNPTRTEAVLEQTNSKTISKDANVVHEEAANRFAMGYETPPSMFPVFLDRHCY